MWQQRVFSGYLRGPSPYVWRHITESKDVLSALLNKKHFIPSFIWYAQNKQN